MEELELIIDYPSRIGDMLIRDEIDMGLVPVAVITRMPEYYINGNYGIGSDGPVASVCLFSETPVQEIRRVLLDYQSRTSVELARILLERYWKVRPELVNADFDFQDQIRGTTAGVVIGDRAFQQRKISSYVYDLGEAWKNMTGLPFVFAAWISNKPLDPEFIARFDEANRMGVCRSVRLCGIILIRFSTCTIILPGTSVIHLPPAIAWASKNSSQRSGKALIKSILHVKLPHL